MTLHRYSTASQLSGLSRMCATRKNVDGTSSTDNEAVTVGNCSAPSRPSQGVPDQNDANAAAQPGTSARDRATTGSDTTVGVRGGATSCH